MQPLLVGPPRGSGVPGLTKKRQPPGYSLFRPLALVFYYDDSVSMAVTWVLIWGDIEVGDCIQKGKDS